MTKKRFSREDWLEFGLIRLAEDGPGALKLTVLCETAERTIGSFYHHFEDQAAFFDALLAYWRENDTIGVIRALEELPDAAAQAASLDAIALSMNQAVEVGIRHFASQNKRAAAEVAAVDKMRMDYLAGMYGRSFDISDGEARLLAELEYAAFVGAQMVWKGGLPQRGNTLSGLFRKLIGGTYTARIPSEEMAG